jgi:Ser/Thr protein kinase RdoA (MazF antagonist)
MSTSTKITWLANPQRVAAEVLARYGLTATRLTTMSTSHNAVYRVKSAGGDFALRLHWLDEYKLEPDAGRRYINSELLWLQALSRDTAIGVPQPLPNLDGELVTLVQDEGKLVPCSMLRWVEGRFYNKGLRGGQLERVGEITALLHNYSESGQFVPPPGFLRERADGLDGPNRIFELLPMQTHEREVVEYVGGLFGGYDAEASTTVSAAIARVWPALAEFGIGADRFGLIHADIHQWNYLFWRGEIKLLDFNNVGYAHYLYDLAVTLNNLLDRDDYPALRAALLHGYQRVRPLPANYPRYLDNLIALRDLQVVQWPITLPLDSAERRQHWSGVARGLEHLHRYLADGNNW